MAENGLQRLRRSPGLNDPSRGAVAQYVDAYAWKAEPFKSRPPMLHVEQPVAERSPLRPDEQELVRAPCRKSRDERRRDRNPTTRVGLRGAEHKAPGYLGEGLLDDETPTERVYVTSSQRHGFTEPKATHAQHGHEDVVGRAYGLRDGAATAKGIERGVAS